MKEMSQKAKAWYLLHPIIKKILTKTTGAKPHTFKQLHFHSNHLKHLKISKHLKKSNAACVYTPIVLKLLIIVQM